MYRGKNEALKQSIFAQSSIFQVDITPKTLSVLGLSDKSLQECIKFVAKHLISLYDYNYKEQFLIGNFEILEHSLRDHSFIICNLGNDNYVIICIVKLEGNVHVLCKGCFDVECFNKLKEIFNKHFEGKNVVFKTHENKLIEPTYNNVPFIASNFEVILKSKRKNGENWVNNFEKLSFTGEKNDVTPITFRFGLNNALSDMVPFLNLVIKQDKEYLLKDKLLQLLCKVLSSDYKEDKLKLKLEILKIIVVALKTRGQNLSQGHRDSIKEYVKLESRKYLDKFLKIDEDFLSAENAKDEFKEALNQNLDFLINISQLDHKLLDASLLDEFIVILCGDNRKKVKEMIDKSQVLLEKTRKLKDSIDKLKNEHYFDDLRTEQNVNAENEQNAENGQNEKSVPNADEEKIEDLENHETFENGQNNKDHCGAATNYDKLENRIEMLTFKDEIILSLDLSNLIVAYEKAWDPSKDHICKEIILNKFVEVGKSTSKEEVALSIVKFINKFPKSVHLKNFHRNILQQIGNCDANLIAIFELGEGDRFGSKSADHIGALLARTHQVIVGNEDSKLRKRALKIMQSYEGYLSAEMTSAVRLEDVLSSNKDKSQISNCLEHVESQYKLPISGFKLMKHHFNESETFCAIKMIVERSIQVLPEFFVKAFNNHAKSSLNANEIEIGKLMILGNYLKLSHFERLKNDIDGKDDCKPVLELIRVGTQKGELLPESLLKKIDKIKNPNLIPIINAIKNVETKSDILKDPKKSLKEKLDILLEILKDENFSDLGIIGILQDVIEYEDDLRPIAFRTLVKILPHDYSSKNISVRFKSLFEVLSASDVAVDDLVNLVKKDVNIDLSSAIVLMIQKLIVIEKDKSLSVASELTIPRYIVDEYCLKSIDESLKGIGIRGITFTDKQKKNLKNSIFKLKDQKGQRLLIEFIENKISMEDCLLKVAIDNANVLPGDLSFLSKCVDSDYVFDDLIIPLIDFLGNVAYKNFHAKMDKLLLKMHVHRRMDDRDVLNDVLERIGGNPSLIRWKSVFSIVTNALSNGVPIEDEIVGKLCQHLTGSGKELKDLFNVIAENNAISRENFEVILNFFNENFGNSLEIGIFTASLVAKQITISEPDFYRFVGILKRHLRGFYNCLRRKLAGNENDLIFLDNYAFDESQYIKKRISLLCTICGVLSSNIPVNTCIFSDFEMNEWQKEILCSALIGRPNQIDEVQLQLYLENIRKLENFVAKRSSSDRLLINILQALLNKVSYSGFQIDYINELLILSRSDVDSLQIISSPSSEFRGHYFTRLKKLFLEKTFRNFRINFEDEQVNELIQIDIFKTTQIAKVVEKCKDRKNALQFVNFFKLLEKCNLSDDDKNRFIDNIEQNASINVISNQLKGKIVEKMLAGKFTLLNAETCVLFRKLLSRLTTIFVSGWKEHSIAKLIGRLIESEDVMRAMLDSIEPIVEYQLREYCVDSDGKKLINVFDDPFEFWQTSTHKIAIDYSFRGTHVKSLDELLSEIDVDDSTRENLKQYYESITKCFQDKGIETWSKNKIKGWAAKIRSKKVEVDVFEKIAVIKRAVEIFSKYSPRDVQILSLFCLLNRNVDKGRLAQINTGEGKTLIIAMLATVLVLDGHRVDVVTSSPELARPQSNHYKDFYGLFGLTVSHNGSDERDITACYRADVVYGAASDFQGDILRDEYMRLGSRSGRKFDVVIVDEADSMLIDFKTHFVMLSSPMPGMNHLEPLLAAISLQVNQEPKNIVVENGVAYCVDREPFRGSKDASIKERIETHIRKMLRDEEHLGLEDTIPEDYPEIEVPKHLKFFVTEIQLTKWIDSAIRAITKYEINKHYVVQDGKVLPVDAHNTGIIQRNMHWSNGLHQFLQIKHGLRVTPENLTNCFISNVAFFKRYGKNVYGLTGTLGSAKAKELLCETYDVDCVVIPPFKRKQHVELLPVVTKTEDEWFDTIVDNSLRKLRIGRAVLIITKFISEAAKIFKLFEERGYDKRKIKMYSCDHESEVVNQTLKAGEVIIATNIAGRGTDIKPSDQVDTSGGLHLCKTFVAPNERTGKQNDGRTSRTGNKGTSQFIVLSETEDDVEQLIRTRDLAESYSLMNAKMEIEKVLRKDALFRKYCKLIDEMSRGIWSIHQFERRAVEERFAIWLLTQEQLLEDENQSEALNTNFDKFKKKILLDKCNRKLIENPYFHVLRANYYLEEKDFINAIGEYQKAIELDENYAENAYYHKGYALIANCESDTKENKKIAIDEAVACFNKSREIIEDRQKELQLIQSASNELELSKQVVHKTNLYACQKDIIDYVIGADVTFLEDQIDSLALSISEEGKTKQEKNQTAKRMKSLEEKRKLFKNGGAIGQALKSNRKIKISSFKIDKNSMNMNVDEDVIQEFKNNGFLGTFTISKIKPIQWKAVIGLTIIGLTQIVIGSGVMVFTTGIGSAIGVVMIGEGVSDLITVITDGIYYRNFSWKSWGIRKAICYTIGILVAGLSRIVDVSKGVVSGAKFVLKGRVIAPESIKRGFLLAAKTVSVTLGKQCATEAVVRLADHTLQNYLYPIIHDKLSSFIQDKILTKLLEIESVRNLLESSFRDGNPKCSELIKKYLMDSLISFTKSYQSLIYYLGKQIVFIINSNLAQYMLALDALIAGKYLLLVLGKLFDNFCNIIKAHETKNEEREKGQELELRVEKTEEERLKDERERSVIDGKIYAFCRALSEKIAIEITNFILQKAVSLAVNRVFKKLEVRIEQDILDYQAKMQIIFQDGDTDGKIGKKFKLSCVDKSLVRIANERVEVLERGGEIGLAELGNVSAVIERPIRVLDASGRVKLVVGEGRSGSTVDIEYHRASLETTRGAYYTLPGKGAPEVDGLGRSDSMLNAISEQTAVKAAELRIRVAENVRANICNYANQVPDIKRLEVHRKHALMYESYATSGEVNRINGN